MKEILYDVGLLVIVICMALSALCLFAIAKRINSSDNFIVINVDKLAKDSTSSFDPIDDYAQ